VTIGVAGAPLSLSFRAVELRHRSEWHGEKASHNQLFQTSIGSIKQQRRSELSKLRLCVEIF